MPSVALELQGYLQPPAKRGHHWKASCTPRTNETIARLYRSQLILQSLVHRARRNYTALASSLDFIVLRAQRLHLFYQISSVFATTLEAVSSVSLRDLLAPPLVALSPT